MAGNPKRPPSGAKLKSNGRTLPEARLNVSVPVPPVAAIVSEYAEPTVPLGSGEVVVNMGLGLTVSSYS